MAYTKKRTEDKLVICPFYHEETEREIACDGIVGDRTINCFKNKEQKNDHKYDFCKGLYQNCPLCIELELKGE